MNPETLVFPDPLPLGHAKAYLSSFSFILPRTNMFLFDPVK